MSLIGYNDVLLERVNTSTGAFVGISYPDKSTYNLPNSSSCSLFIFLQISTYNHMQFFFCYYNNINYTTFLLQSQ